MPRFGGVTDFLPLSLVLVQEQRPGARFFTLQTLMPESGQPRFHINYSGRSRIGVQQEAACSLPRLLCEIVRLWVTL